MWTDKIKMEIKQILHYCSEVTVVVWDVQVSGSNPLVDNTNKQFQIIICM